MLKSRYETKMEALERLRSFRILMDEPIGRLLFGDPDRENRVLDDVVAELQHLQSELQEIVNTVEQARRMR